MPVDPYTTPTAHVADPTSLAGETRSFLVRCWRGEARLWQAFWLVLVLGYVATNLISLTLILTATRLNNNIAVVIAVSITALMNLTVLVFALVSVWRCAPNTRFIALKLPSRALLIGLVPVLAMQFIQGIHKGQRMIEERRQQEQQQSSEWPSNIELQGSHNGVAALAVAAP